MVRKNPKDYMTGDIYRGSYSLSELQQMRRALAKRANQRIVRLERAKSKVTGERYNTFGAIVDVMDYLQRKNRSRFSEQLNTTADTQALRREITVLRTFLERPTSTVKGMREIERKRLKSFESGKWGTYNRTGIPNKPIKFATNKEFYDFLNSETFKGLISSGFTSEQIVELYDTARQHVDDTEVVEAMAQALEAYREQGNANLKDLKKRMNAKTLKGSGNNATSNN